MTVFSERVIETTTTTGTGTYSLGGAPGGARTFVAAFGSGVSVPYRVQNSDNTIWEERYGLITDASPDTLTRGTLIRSSTGSSISWGAGTKYVYNLPQASILDALLKGNIGSSRPAWLEAGGSWIDNSGTPWLLNLWNGTVNRVLFRVNDSTGAVSAPCPRGHLSGLALSNNGSDATNDIDIASGIARDGSDAYDLLLASALTKRLDAAWAVGTGNGGLDTGSIANTTYHIWLIARSDTGVVDALFSTSASAPTMPANYDHKRRIGSIIRASGAILGFVQDGDRFMLKAPVVDASATNPGTSAVTETLESIPAGIRVAALLTASLNTTTTGSNLYVSDLALDDTAAAFSGAGQAATPNIASGGNRQKADLAVMTNTSRQVRYRLSNSDANTSLGLTTNGWIDRRGRDD